MLTQERLKQLLNYEPNTGVFTWRITRGSRAQAGAVAGSIDKDGYEVIRIDKKIHKSHRLAFLYITGSMPPKDTDHINGQRADNRWINIRAVTRSENLRNQKLHSSNKSGCMGVYFRTDRGKWTSYINCEGKREYLGESFSKGAAIRLRRKAEEMHGFLTTHGRT